MIRARFLLLISVMLALLLTGTLVIATTTAQTQQPVVSTVFQHFDVTLIRATTSPPTSVLMAQSPETWIPYQLVELKIPIATNQSGQFEIMLELGSSPPFSHSFAEMVNSLTLAEDGIVAATGVQSITKYRLTNDAGGKMQVAISNSLHPLQTRFNAAQLVSFST